MKLRTKHSYWKTGRKCLKNIFIAASCAEIFLHDCVVRLYFRRALESGPRSSSRGDWGEERGLASRSAASVQAHCVLRNNSWLFDVLVWQIYYSIFILYKDLNVQSLSISLNVILVCQQKFSFWKVHWWKQRSAHTVFSQLRGARCKSCKIHTSLSTLYNENKAFLAFKETKLSPWGPVCGCWLNSNVLSSSPYFSNLHLLHSFNIRLPSFRRWLENGAYKCFRFFFF